MKPTAGRRVLPEGNQSRPFLLVGQKHHACHSISYFTSMSVRSAAVESVENSFGTNSPKPRGPQATPVSRRRPRQDHRGNQSCLPTGQRTPSSGPQLFEGDGHATGVARQLWAPSESRMGTHRSLIALSLSTTKETKYTKGCAVLTSHEAQLRSHDRLRARSLFRYPHLFLRACPFVYFVSFVVEKRHRISHRVRTAPNA